MTVTHPHHRARTALSISGRRGALPLLTTGGARRLLLDERGAATAEYAIATMATMARF